MVVVGTTKNHVLMGTLGGQFKSVVQVSRYAVASMDGYLRGWMMIEEMMKR